MHEPLSLIIVSWPTMDGTLFPGVKATQTTHQGYTTEQKTLSPTAFNYPWFQWRCAWFHTSPLHVETLRFPVLSTSCERNHSCTESIHVMTMSYSKDLILSQISQPLLPGFILACLLWWPESWRGYFSVLPPLTVSVLASEFPHQPHPPQWEASLMKAGCSTNMSRVT